MGIGARRIDESLVAAAIAGDDAALGQVIDAWLPAVYAWCGRLGAGRIDPEEAAHDVMMLLVRKHHTVIPAQLGAWLFGACRRVVANHRRRLWWRRRGKLVAVSFFLKLEYYGGVTFDNSP